VGHAHKFTIHVSVDLDRETLEIADITAGTKRLLAGAREHNDPDIFVVCSLSQSITHFSDTIKCERIHAMRTIERYSSHSITKIEENLVGLGSHYWIT